MANQDLFNAYNRARVAHHFRNLRPADLAQQLNNAPQLNPSRSQRAYTYAMQIPLGAWELSKLGYRMATMYARNHLYQTATALSAPALAYASRWRQAVGKPKAKTHGVRKRYQMGTNMVRKWKYRLGRKRRPRRRRYRKYRK